MKEAQPWRDYHGEWPAIRDAVLREEPFCRCGCGRRSEVVDHISPRRVEIAAGRDPNRRANLQALAKVCHDRKTARETEFGRQAG